MADTVTRNPWPKRLLIGALVLLLILAALVIGAWVWINSGAGRSFVENTVEDMEVAGQTITLDGLDGSVLGSFEIDRVELKGRDGVWLVARDITVDWNPRALLSKTLDVDALRVGDLDVLDRPVLIPSGDDSPQRVTQFDIDGIDLPDVFFAEPVTTREVQLRASGRLSHGSEGGMAVIDAVTEQGDTVDANLAWSPLLVLSGEADIDGAPGGLLATLLRLDPGQSVTADVVTEAEVTTVRAQIDGAEFVDAQITRSQTQVSVNGTMEPNRLPVLQSLAPTLGGRTEVEATLPLDTGATAALTLRSPLTTLRATGVREGSVLVLSDVSVEATDPLAPFELDGISLGRIIARGKARIDTQTRGGSFEGQVDGRNIRYQSYAVERLSGPARFTFTDGVLGFDTKLSGQASGTAARVNGAVLDMRGRLDTQRQSLRLSRANIDLPGLALKGAGAVDYGGGVTAEFGGDYRVDTSVFRDGPAAILSGDAEVNMTPNGPVARLRGRADDITGLASAVEPLFTGGVDYVARVEIDEGEVLVPSFTVSNDNIRAEGDAVWFEGRLRADIDYTADSYDFAAVSASGIAGEAKLEGPPERIGFATRTTLDRLNANALTMTDAVALADGVFEGGVITADVDLRGTSEQGPVATTFNVVLDNGNWDVTGLEGSLGGLRTRGTISGFGGDIAAIRADLVVGGTSPLVPAESIDGTIKLLDSQVDVDLTLASLAAGPLSATDVKLLAKGPREAVRFSVAADGRVTVREIDRKLVFRADGTADLAEPDLSVAAPFQMTVARQELAGDINARRGADGWGGTLAMRGLGGSAEAALQPGADGAMSFSIDRLTLAEIMTLLGRPVAGGTLSGDGEFRFLADRIEGQAALTLDDLKNPGTDAEPVSVAVDVNLANEQLDARLASVDEGLTGQITVSGPVDTFPRAPFLQWPPAVPLEGKADLDGDIGALAELFLPPQTDVTGQIDADISFVQPTDPARLNGTLRLSNASFEQGALGLHLVDINLAADMAGQTIDVSNFSARGKDGGTLQGSGRMGLGEGTGSVDIRAEKLRVVERREGRAEVSGTLSVSRTAELFKLGGDLLVTDAEFNIARLPKPGLPTLDVDFNEEDDVEEDDPRFASQTTALDLRVRSNGRIEVKGRGLDTLMDLDARVTGPFDAPVITGDAGFARGRFDFLGKRFVFRDSDIELNTDILQSRLDMTAVRETSDLTALVRITGTVERPDIELSSEPTLPEDEVLSRILFGRSPTQLSAIEAARFAAALAQLSGGSGFDLLGSVENAIGLDTLDIGQSDTGQTQLTTGKYLSDDVYVEVRSAAEGTPGIAVEWQARRNISVEAETVPGESQSVSVQWKKDFD